MAFDDVDVGVKVTYDSSQLKQAIADFKEGKLTIQQLQDATKSLNEDIKVQNSAIRTFNTAQRVQHFEMIQNIRLLTQFTSLMSSMNSVIQTSILRNIEQNQTTVAQREAFKDLIGTTDNLVNALDLLGPANSEVQSAFKGLIRDADSLNSKQLTDLIEHLENLKKNGNLSAEEIDYLNEKIQVLRDLLKETKADESAKGFNDLLASITALGLAAGSLGQFILQLQRFNNIGGKARGILAGLARFGIKTGGGAAATVGLVSMLGEQTASAPVVDASGKETSTEIKMGAEAIPEILTDIYNKLSGQTKEINITVENMSIRSDADLYDWSKKMFDMIKDEESKGAP